MQHVAGLGSPFVPWLVGLMTRVTGIPLAFDLGVITGMAYETDV